MCYEFPLPRVRWPHQNDILLGSVVRKPSFEHCIARWAAWQASNNWLLAFKIGIAFDPRDRFLNKSFGYILEQRWHFMEVMCSGESNEIRQLEMQLISALKKFQGCMNERGGGDGVSPETQGTCFSYMVFARAGDGIGLQAAWKKALLVVLVIGGDVAGRHRSYSSRTDRSRSSGTSSSSSSSCCCFFCIISCSGCCCSAWWQHQRSRCPYCLLVSTCPPFWPGDVRNSKTAKPGKVRTVRMRYSCSDWASKSEGMR